MSKKSNKNKESIGLNKVEEPAIEYKSTLKESQLVSDEEWEAMPEQLKKLIEIGLEQCRLGQTKPHEQVMAEMKKKIQF